MSGSTIRAFVDRIEGDIAVLLVGDEKLELRLPKVLLSEPVEEGSWLKLTIKVDQDAAQDAGERIARLLEDLGG
jgi:hypothetical protein